MRRDEIKSGRLKRLFEYWQEKRAAGMLPGRGSLDPLDFDYILGDVALIDVQRQPWRFRYRLVGTGIVARSGIDLTGKSPEDHPWPEYRALLQETYRAIAQSGEAAVFERQRLIDGKIRRFEVLYLPLASDGREVDMLLVAIEPDLPRVGAGDEGGVIVRLGEIMGHRH